MMEFALDKSTWKPVTFGEVVREVRETVSDFEAEGIERSVGLEHIESENIHIRSWGNVGDSATFNRRFRKGQVLFGRRRAYLKKAALADFDGVCSGDITVLEAKPDLLLPELLPFLVQNDRFFAYAVEKSAGSLSPRAKFQDLAPFPFLLPPKDQQARLAELLWAGDEVVEARQGLLEKIGFFYRILRDEGVIGTNSNSQDLEINDQLNVKVPKSLKFQNLGSAITDIKYGSSKKSNNQGDGYPVLRIPNVVNEELNENDIAHIDVPEQEFNRYKLDKGDIVFVRTNGNPQYVGRSAIFNMDGNWAFASYLIKVVVNNKLYLPDFLIKYFQSTPVRRYFNKKATSSAGNYNINTETIKSLPIPALGIKEQKELVDKLSQVENSLKLIEQHLLVEKSLQKSLLSQIF